MQVHFCKKKKNRIIISPIFPHTAWAWGDPHITTVDGDVFTFNGWGEYSLLELNASSTMFTLQGRTGNISASEGSATKLIAFAFGMSTLRVQVSFI